MRLSFALVLVFAVACWATHDAGTMSKFTSWMTKFDKSYDSAAEFEHAFHNFVDSIARCEANNKRTGKSYYGLTKFSDLSPAEFKRMYLTADHSSKSRAADLKRRTGYNVDPPAQVAPQDIPKTSDWRLQPPFPVTAVKDQGQCGSCWAFSATENIESMHILANPGAKVNLSPEQIVDCDKGRGDQGCGGGDTPTAFEYVTAAGGIESNDDYPYTAGGGTAGSCAFDKTKVKAQINNFTWAIPLCTDNCDSQPIDDLRAKLNSTGPFAICVYAQTWQDYSGGGAVFDDASCIHSYPQLDHCVQLVGYNWGDQGYWIVRNSWNDNWGTDGYIYISSTVANGNLCGVADEVNYANQPK